MWQLNSQTDTGRSYTNSTTGSRCGQTMLKVDKEGNKWYGFNNLMEIPYTRNFAATKITSLFALGLTKDDLTGFVGGIKGVLKSTDADKYEKAYALVLDFENKATNATDPVKQMSSLVCVYYTMNDEPIDSFDGTLQIKKMSILEADVELHSFFLASQINLIEDYTARLNLLSAIASPPSNGKQDLLI